MKTPTLKDLLKEAEANYTKAFKQVVKHVNADATGTDEYKDMKMWKFIANWLAGKKGDA